MRRDLKTNLLTCFLITYTILSILYQSSSLNFNISEVTNEDHENNNYSFNDFYVLSFDFYSYYSTSKEDLHISQTYAFFESLQNQTEETLNIFFLNCLGSFGFLFLVKNISTIKISKKSFQQDQINVNLTETELKVFNLIQEFINNNKVFDKEKVSSYIKSRSLTNGNLNSTGISAIIDNLLKKKILLEGSKLTRKTVLLNSNREKIFNLIQQNPGIYRNKICKMLSLSPFVVNWHLSKLLAFNLIRKIKINTQICYFDITLDKKHDYLFYTINQTKCRKLINFLTENEKFFTKNQICKELKMHFNTVIKYTNQMSKYGLLIRKKINQREYFSINFPKVRELLNNIEK